MIGTHRTTVSTTPDGTVRVTYHNTVVAAKRGDIITLDSGGWRTPTTKRRINQALEVWGRPERVVQRDYEWVISHPDGTSEPFSDGVQLRDNQ